MIELLRANRHEEAWARRNVRRWHYRHCWPSTQGSLFPYVVRLALPDGARPLIGVLLFSRLESTECYQVHAHLTPDQQLTYGDLDAVGSGRARYSVWELLNLARVWFRPSVQHGGRFCRPGLVPGYVDRRGQFRSTLATTAIGLALERIPFAYLAERPPVWVDQPYALRECVSYCDTTQHKGTIYRAAGFRYIRTNEEGKETWAKQLRPLTLDEDALVRKRAQQSKRSIEKRAEHEAKGLATLALDI